MYIKFIQLWSAKIGPHFTHWRAIHQSFVRTISLYVRKFSLRTYAQKTCVRTHVRTHDIKDIVRTYASFLCVHTHITDIGHRTTDNGHREMAERFLSLSNAAANAVHWADNYTKNLLYHYLFKFL